MQKFVIKMFKELSQSSHIPPLITMDEEEEEREEEECLGQCSTLYVTLDLNFDAGGSLIE